MSLEENKKPSNPNAFPSEKTEIVDIAGRDISHKVHYQGMTLRDYFASKAMNGMVTAFYSKEPSGGPEEILVQMELISKNAYWFADTMLKERERILITPECILHKREGCEKCFPRPEFPKDRIETNV